MLLGIVTGLLLAAAPDAAATPQADRPVEKKVCHREVETGSLIKGKKVCRTVKEWQKIADASRDEMERSSSMGSQSGK